MQAKDERNGNSPDDRIERLIAEVKKDLDLEDPCTRVAFDDFIAASESARLDHIPLEAIHRELNSPRVFDATVQLQQKSIHRNACAKRYKLAERAEELASGDLWQIIYEDEGITPEETWQLNTFHLLLLVKGYDARAEGLSWLSAWIEEMPEMTDEYLRRLKDGRFSKEVLQMLARAQAKKEFLTDLAGVLLQTGDDGREFLRDLTRERGLAEQVLEDQKVPALFRSAAALLLRYGKAHLAGASSRPQ